MGEVWRGAHRAQGIAVAVKVLTAKGMGRSFFLSAFRNEVRAMAGLDHPCIALVLDHGEVSEESARSSEGRLVAGSPYLAMELAHGGSMAPWCGRLAWAEVRQILLCLLDALAHAHARGVIHRDLKPANVLLGSERDVRPGVKLTDFGLAHIVEAIERPTARGPTAGTPHYMAPEQIHGRRRDYGPWTDLYSLGRVALALVWGTPALSGTAGPCPVPVPRGFDSWVSRLLQREPDDRFQRAADAALALLELGQPPDEHDGGIRLARLGISAETFALSGVESTSVSRSGLDSPNSPTPVSNPHDGATTVVGLHPREPSRRSRPPREGALIEDASSLMGLTDDGTDALGEPCAKRPPPIPSTWRRSEPTLAPMRLLGAGLGLYGLRAISLVDREPEREELWEALRAVSQSGRARAVLLRGPAGCGKSRLAEWLCERAHEVGAATILRTTHAPIAGPADGLPAGLARLMRCTGLDRRRLALRVEVMLRQQGVRDADEWHALTELISPASESDTDPEAHAVRFGSPVERYVLVGRMLERVARERPIILWLDDVHWGLDALEFARHFLQSQEDRPVPALVVLTALEEALSERPAESAALQALVGQGNTRQLHVGPLPADAHGMLVRGLLGLEGELAARVEARSAGNPLFAVQLVGDWVHRGLLEVGEQGFRLRPGARMDMPDLLHKVWAARVESVLRGRPAAHGVALEIAAVLGQDVVVAEWRAACAREGVDAPAELVEALMEQRLARSSDRGADEEWAFVHNMLRESLERRARESGRWWAHHRACAAMLMARVGEGRLARDPGVAERLGRHLLAAGDVEEALNPLRVGVEARLATGDYGLAALLLGERDAAIAMLNLGDQDPRCAIGWLLHSRLSRAQGRMDESLTWANRALDCARSSDWSEIQARALCAVGATTWNLGQPDRAVAVLLEAESLAQTIGDHGLLGDIRRDLGNIRRRRGDLAEADACFRRALHDDELVGHEVGAAYSLLGLGEIAGQRGQSTIAAQNFERALASFERAGARRGVADCLNSLGELARLAGNFEEAEARYRAALARFHAIGSGLASMPECNLGLTLIERGQYLEARRILTAVLQVFRREGRVMYASYVNAYLLPCAAVAQDWEAFARHLSDAGVALAELGVVDLDIARMATLAGDIAATLGQTGRAREAYALATQQWRGLGRADSAQAVLDRVTDLDD